MLVPNSQYHKPTGPNMMELMAVSNLKVAGSALRHINLLCIFRYLDLSSLQQGLPERSQIGDQIKSVRIG